MIRKIITIDESKCNGCGICAEACHEGAIGMVDGRDGHKVAALLRDDYCDGLGDCLPACPTAAISFEEREAAAYDEEAVKRLQAQRTVQAPPKGCCPGSNAHAIRRETPSSPQAAPAPTPTAESPSQLNQWPVQLKLVPVNAPYFDGAKLLIAAACPAFAYADFHNRFMRNHVTLIGCPKLDAPDAAGGDYSEKLTAILRGNNIKSVTVVRMEVPCCGGIANAAIQALQNCGKMLPWQVVTISTDGQILDQI